MSSVRNNFLSIVNDTQRDKSATDTDVRPHPMISNRIQVHGALVSERNWNQICWKVQLCACKSMHIGASFYYNVSEHAYAHRHTKSRNQVLNQTCSIDPLGLPWHIWKLKKWFLFIYMLNSCLMGRGGWNLWSTPNGRGGKGKGVWEWTAPNTPM